MANLYKKTIVILDRRTGLKVKSKSKKWWGRFRDDLGRDKRVPLARNKVAAQAMLNHLVERAELRAAGCIDFTDEYAKLPVEAQIDQFEEQLRYKGDSQKHAFEVASKLRKFAAALEWNILRNIEPTGVQRYLASRREQGLSRQTSNHYLRAAKQFTRWLVRDRRIRDDPLTYLSSLNVKVDRRHDRRSLSLEEFGRLVDAAMTGPEIACISGRDRAMMYILAAWTGYRKSEIGSLTKGSFCLDSDPPTVTVAACYSKRKRRDVQILHCELVSRLRDWFETKLLLPDDALLFPISANVPGGINRPTSKMMNADLRVARKKWIEESETDQEKASRAQTSFLKYQNNAGLFADFHSNRHTFITNLEHSRASVREAQSLARHSDSGLTLGTYTHIDLADQLAAIRRLPAPPPMKIKGSDQPSAPHPTRTVGNLSQLGAIWDSLPEGARNRVLDLASEALGKE